MSLDLSLDSPFELPQISISLMKQKVSEGLVIAKTHPIYPLTIYNYSQTVQFKNLWDEYTLMARGLILDNKGNIIGRPFAKFFNWEEMTEIPKEPPVHVTEKMDGSLIIACFYKEELILATRGSFTSEQAQKAKEIVEEKYAKVFNELPRDRTYLFELIHPENTIVLRYGKTRDLFYLASIDNNTGKDIFTKGMNEYFPIPEQFPYKNLHPSEMPIADDKEGYVLYYASGLRIKVKGEVYKKLHQIRSGLTENGVWEMLRNGEDLEETIKMLPDESYNWFKKTRETILTDYKKALSTSENIYQEIKNLPTRKEQALALKNSPYASIVFGLLDGKDVSSSLWKICKPINNPELDDE